MSKMEKLIMQKHFKSSKWKFLSRVLEISIDGQGLNKHYLCSSEGDGEEYEVFLIML